VWGRQTRRHEDNRPQPQIVCFQSIFAGALFCFVGMNTSRAYLDQFELIDAEKPHDNKMINLTWQNVGGKSLFCCPEVYDEPLELSPNLVFKIS
jgi:hypothetical protein